MTQQHNRRSFPLPLILFVGAGLATAGAVGYYTWDLATGEAVASGEYRLTQSKARMTPSPTTSAVVPLPSQEKVPQTTPVAPNDALTGNTSEDDPLLPPHSRVGRTYLGLGDQPTTTWRVRPDTTTSLPTGEETSTTSAEPSDTGDSSADGSTATSTSATVPTHPGDNGGSATTPDGTDSTDSPTATDDPSVPTRPNFSIPTLPSLIPAPLEPTANNHRDDEPTSTETNRSEAPSQDASRPSTTPSDAVDRDSTADTTTTQEDSPNVDSPATNPGVLQPTNNAGSLFIPDFLRNKATEAGPVGAAAHHPDRTARSLRSTTPPQNDIAPQSRASDSADDTSSGDTPSSDTTLSE